MKIIYFCRALAIKGGLEKILVDKMNYLAENYGYDVYIITSDQNVHPLAFQLQTGVTHVDLNINFYKRFKYNIFKRFYLYWKMKRMYIRKSQKIICTIKPDALIFTTNFLFEFTLIKSKYSNIPIVIESHSARTSIFTNRSWLSSIYYNYLENSQEKSITNADALICLTNVDAMLWKSIKDAKVIPNMINKSNLEKSDYSTQKRIICVGRLADEKGYDMLINAWKIISSQYQDWHIDIFGAGEKEDELKYMIKSFGISNIQLKGITNDVNSEYVKSDFLILSSRYEGFGLVLAEAMACGIPCVSFDCPCGPSDIIRDKEDGLLVENGNVEKLAEAISWMIEHPKERLKMGERAKHNVERFYPENIMPQWDKLFKEIVYGKQ